MLTVADLKAVVAEVNKILAEHTKRIEKLEEELKDAKGERPKAQASRGRRVQQAKKDT